jgi:CBS domain-containing protein
VNWREFSLRIIKLRVHFTWIFIIALVTVIVTTQFSEDYQLVEKVILGLVVSLTFLVIVAVREIIIGLAVNQPEKLAWKMTLFAFGGVYLQNREIVAPAHLPLLYFARLFSNLVIAVIFYGLFATFINTSREIAATLTQWLAYIYFLVFLLNLIPAYPLEGGQFLRLWIWQAGGDYYKATRITSFIGLLFGLLLIFAGGLFFIITRQWTISILLVVVGWVIQNAAGTVRRQVKIRSLLQPVRAADIMRPDYPAQSARLTVRQIVKEYILQKGWNYLIVEEDGIYIGLLTLAQVKKLPFKVWNSVTLSKVMYPARSVPTSSPQQPADFLYEEMLRTGIDCIPVMDNGKVAGVVTRSDLLELVRVRSRFLE